MLRALALLTLIFSGTACMQTNNSSSGDLEKYGRAVNSIFTNNCSGCHNFQGTSTDDLVASGRVIRGNPDNSPLYFHLRGSTSPMAVSDMPPSGALSTVDVAAIHDWIAGL